MNDFVDAPLHEEQKEKRIKQIQDKKADKLRKTPEEIEEELEFFLRREHRRKFEPKPPKSFRNNQRTFQYDYEEDFYEPDYEEDGF